MSKHTVRVQWNRAGADFVNGSYSREHKWFFDGGAMVPASSSPSLVPEPYSNSANVDPEEAFIAAVSSCHLLWFLSIAAKQGFVVDAYTDAAIGAMTQNESGKLWISSITLNPTITYSGERLPTREQEERIHHLAHQECFIASSIKTYVTVSLDG